MVAGRRWLLVGAGVAPWLALLVYMLQGGGEAVPDDALHVHVVAKLGAYTFVYPNGVRTSGELLVPVGRTTVLHLTSRDVTHRFTSEALSAKVRPDDAVALSFAPTHEHESPIECQPECGHGDARIRAVGHDAFDAFLHERPSKEELARGYKLAGEHGCLGCHSTRGQESSGPSWQHAFGRELRLADGRSVWADEAYMIRAIMEPSLEVVEGYPPTMPSYLGVLSPAEVGPLLELIRSLR